MPFKIQYHNMIGRCDSLVTFHSSLPRKRNKRNNLGWCEGVVLLKSGNKETLYLVSQTKTSRNRGLFLCKLATIIDLIYI